MVVKHFSLKYILKTLLALISILLMSCLTTSSQEVSVDNTTEKTTGKAPKSTDTVQVLLPSSENLSETETAWLPGQIQDRLKSNIQEYFGVRTVVDSNAEKSLKKLQAESESGARDENTAIELGKITTAKYGLFSKIRKTGSGYSISADYTDLTTGVQVASATSKEYSRAEYLYGSTGAVDEVTLVLANKLNIRLSDLTQNLLASGSADFSVDAQLALAKQNEEQYQKLMKQYDDELKRLSVSNDLSAIENKKKIEAEKALLAEKQKSEQKRLAELAAQKQQAESDAKLEAERSIELKTQRDNLAAQAATKAAQVRKLKLDKQGVLGQITVIEGKKKALVEIRKAVETRYVELYNQMKKDKKVEEEKIRDVPWSIVELKDGHPTEAAKQGRDNLVAESNRNIEDKFIADCESVVKSTDSQDVSLMAEIRSDTSKLSQPRKVNSFGDELKISFGTYDGEKSGWNAYLSIYSDGINYYNDQFIVDYKSLTEKSAPDITTASKQARDEYIANTDMYNSLLTRGDPILYFELDYSVKAESDDRPSQYVFNFDTIHVFNTVSGKEVQTTKLKKSISKTMVPGYDIRKKDFVKMAKTKIEEDQKVYSILIPLKNTKYINFNRYIYKIITGQNLYEVGSFYDAIYFCNSVSIILGLKPVYAVKGETDVTKWNYTPNAYQDLRGKIDENEAATGYRLPKSSEVKKYSSKSPNEQWYVNDIVRKGDTYSYITYQTYDYVRYQNTIESSFSFSHRNPRTYWAGFDFVRNKMDGDK